jgi:Fe-S-cluster containining protein
MKKSEKLKKIYEQVPDIECRGLCQHSCSFIPMSKFEKKLLTEKFGNANFLADPCPKLSNGKCSIYADRPLVCRLYGVVPEMVCIHGCKPKKMLPSAVGYKLRKKIEKI